MKDHLNVCVVGCGYMGMVHAERWDRLPGASVTTVVDVDEPRAARLANQFKLDKYYTNYQEAVVLPGVDVVSVCIPTNLHADVAVAAARAGKHVLCEKPIALTVADADRMIAAASQNGVQLGLGFMRRHSPVVQALRTKLAEGVLGRPVLYHASDVRELRPKREMHDARANGGPVIDMAVHLIDLWGYIFDSKPVSVYAQGLTLANDRAEIAHIQERAVDTATVVVRYETGDQGTFVVSWGLPPKVNPPNQNDQIYGPNGLAEAYYHMNKQECRIMAEGGSWQTLAISHEDMYANQIAAFAGCLQDGRPFSVRGEDGKAALQVAAAALESICSGQPVMLA